MSRKALFWIAGVVVSSAGVILARFTGTRLGPPLTTPLSITGALLAIVGLGLTAYAARLPRS